MDIPLRERNAMLEAAGLVPAYPERRLNDAEATPFRNAIRSMLNAQEPYPAYVINRWWEVVDVNAAGHRMFPDAGTGTASAIDAFLAPGGYREAIENFAAVGWTFLHRLRREVADAGPDERLEALLTRAEDYMRDVPPPADADLGSDLVVCPRLRVGDCVISTVSMVARFGHARDVTLDELRIELVFPADDEAEAFFRAAAEAAGESDA